VKLLAQVATDGNMAAAYARFLAANAMPLRLY
jgi:hypothetical protein